jgi:hypothetical protein
LYSKVNFYVNILLAIILLFSGVSCGSFTHNSIESQNSDSPEKFQSGFALSQQKAPPDNIQSFQLHPKNNPTAPPILKLNSQQKLVLSFDYLGEESQQFQLQLSHRTKSWQQSTITPSTYLHSFSQTYATNARKSLGRPPSYFHVEFEFPNNGMRPAVSGNYLLEVYDPNGGNLLFSVPFFITEDAGSINSRVERLFAQRDDGRPLDQLYSTYRYPDFVEYPQFDLSISFAQNRFWGQMQQAGFIDTITPNQLSARLEREQAYIGNYEFKTLDLRTFDPDGQQILAYHPGNTPPAIILRRDIQNLDTNPRFFPISNFGQPIDERSSNYARVEFQLEADRSIPPSSDIYVVGHFNNWLINDLNKMTYNSDEQIWEGDALIKQGQYAYKYVLVRNNTIHDLALDQGFVSAEQEYLTFVYFKDPDKNFDRLLKIDRIVKQ